MMRACVSRALVLSTVLAAGAAQASTVDLSFVRVNPANGGATNPASQFNVRVSTVQNQPNQVSFRFTNTAVIYSSISEIYYDSRNTSPLASLLSPLQQNGTNFAGGGANPGNLPGGQNLTPAFNAVTAFSADAQGNPSNGIDAAGDWVLMTFTLAAGKTFNDVIAAVNNGNLRIGLHVRAIRLPGEGGDVSDSFVNMPVVPLPPAAWMGLATLGGLAAAGGVRRR